VGGGGLRVAASRHSPQTRVQLSFTDSQIVNAPWFALPVAMATAKCSLPFHQALIRGILCNWRGYQGATFCQIGQRLKRSNVKLVIALKCKKCNNCALRPQGVEKTARNAKWGLKACANSRCRVRIVVPWMGTPYSYILAYC